MLVGQGETDEDAWGDNALILQRVIKCCNERYVILNSDKMVKEFNNTTNEGIKPDLKKVTAH